MDRLSLGQATFAIVDVETTGFAPTDRVVEVACVVVRGGREAEVFHSLVDPGRPVPRYASDVHGLFDADVAGAPELAALAPTLRHLTKNAIVVAHNASFDRRFLPMLERRRWLCTLRLARHCFPELERHANQYLRHALGLRGIKDAVAHRALGDVRTTAGVLQAALDRYRDGGGDDRVDALLAFAASPTPTRQRNHVRGTAIAVA